MLAHLKFLRALTSDTPPENLCCIFYCAYLAKLSTVKHRIRKNAFTEFQRVKFIFWLSKMGYLRLLEEGEEDKEEVKGVDVSSFKYY